MGKSQLNFCDTKQLPLDCLHHYGNELFTTKTIHYCLRPINDTNSLIVDFVNIRDRNYTLDELRRLKVTTQELLSWSASINLAERYQHYVDQQNNLFVSNEIFFNCTKPWFGSQCQYALESDENISPFDFVKKNLITKWEYDSLDTVTYLTCYIHLKCNRGGSSICLDWREICDGRIDCLDGGQDEAQCFHLETNECDENEYRCHNGLCIPTDFWKLEYDTAECLDQSDLSDTAECPQSYSDHNIFECEEYACRPGPKQFSCGDGQCVADFNECENGRHILLTQSMSAQGNLSHGCWMAIACLTKIIDEVNGTICEQFVRSSRLITHLKSCETLTQFPTIPVIFGHVRFLYRAKDVDNVNIELALAPDYVCYDHQLCNFLTPTFHNGNFTCRSGDEMGFGSNIEYEDWISIIRSIEPYFHGCSSRLTNENDSQDTSLYCCKHSSKCISKHRIIDDILDCYLGDDEQEFELSCSINDTHRFKCPDENKCQSPLVSQTICPPVSHSNLDEITFHQICDRVVDVLPVTIDGRNHTDETECERWPCNNICTRCDGFWSCSDGEDEANCVLSICPSRFLACVSPDNNTLTCLPADRVGDGIIDCVGASDELQYCRTTNFYSGINYQFRCLNATLCVPVSDLCDSDPNCPFGDDEAFCEDRQGICDECDLYDHTNVYGVLCGIGAMERMSFPFENLPIYPPAGNTIINPIAERRVDRHISANDIRSQLEDSEWSRRCNHGFYVHLWRGADNYSYSCFCPPNYYGDMCQYQNERVSLTLKVKAVNQRGIYGILVRLIDDDDRQETNSHDQFIYVSDHNCGKLVNIYLLYSTRPKNNSKNYSVRVDAFDKTSLTHLASWHFKIPFLFLPVNRLAAILTLPAYRAPNPSYCTLTCYNGECIKYTNEEKFFCLCHTGWSGGQCQIPGSCSDCSPDSICVGSIGNRSICVCPLTKFGSRCLLKRSCPTNFCKNNARCIVIDERIHDDSYLCICSEQFYGQRCNVSKGTIEISFHNMEVPPYLVAYIFHEITSESLTAPLMVLQKLSMFQGTVTLYSQYFVEIILVKINGIYYMALLQQSEHLNISTSISPTQRCAPINELFNFRLLTLPRIRLVKHYHVPCQTHLDLMCFFDEFYMCLCTLERHANCFPFSHDINLACQNKIYCQNGAECLQDHPICPSYTVCVCTDCFFGDQCQFYAKGIGLTLDDILRYEITPNVKFSDQSLSVKLSAVFTMIMFVAGLLNSVLSFLVFQSKDSRQVGCGMYLLATSITSLLSVSIFTLKFWFLVLTQMDISISRSVLRGGCVILEPVLKLFVYMDNWLNVCVAIERAVSVFKGINFDKRISKRVARWMILFLPLFIMGTIIYDLLHRDLFDDKEEQRIWCVTRYSRHVQNYSTAIIFFHFLTPFSGNLLSAIFIIFTAARQRTVTRTRQSYKQHLRELLSEHKQLLISPVILVVLSLPRLIISLMSGCVKTSRSPWLYLSGYFISFIPSVAVFVVFVLPSELYKNQFKQSVKRWRRRIYSQ